MLRASQSHHLVRSQLMMTTATTTTKNAVVVVVVLAERVTRMVLLMTKGLSLCWDASPAAKTKKCPSACRPNRHQQTCRDPWAVLVRSGLPGLDAMDFASRWVPAAFCPHGDQPRITACLKKTFQRETSLLKNARSSERTHQDAKDVDGVEDDPP